MFLITYFSKYYDSNRYEWFNTEDKAMEFVNLCKELNNEVNQAMEILEFRHIG